MLYVSGTHTSVHFCIFQGPLISVTAASAGFSLNFCFCCKSLVSYKPIPTIMPLQYIPTSPVAHKLYSLSRVIVHNKSVLILVILQAYLGSQDAACSEQALLAAALWRRWQTSIDICHRRPGTANQQHVYYLSIDTVWRGRDEWTDRRAPQAYR